MRLAFAATSRLSLLDQDRLARQLDAVLVIDRDILEVKVIAVDDQNRVKLSRKAILVEKAQAAGGGEGAPQ